MANFKELLPSINTFIFDVDGVLTDGSVLLLPNGELARKMNNRDGFALQHAIRKGYNICIISGGNSASVRVRLNDLGITDVFLKAHDKVDVFNKYIAQKNISKNQILYMGDDIPDLEAMKLCGVATCPKNAAIEIKNVAHYISDKNGGEGCVRDVIEQVLRCNDNWNN
ncbi:MAG: 3-deoxy-D-manno-octulosonate 8-phosphate phosphatase [Bacteroidetes bacterium HGW-Bacteroidetes-12]|nr:MAG: 3-deoxy-D-manno-octulosonate 8-phosphate phosphatase [Bacteroidetes bacterium HGW-Bacteroidetes-12]